MLSTANLLSNCMAEESSPKMCKGYHRGSTVLIDKYLEIQENKDVTGQQRIDAFKFSTLMRKSKMENCYMDVPPAGQSEYITIIFKMNPLTYMNIPCFL